MKSLENFAAPAMQARGADHIPGSNIPSRNTTVEYVAVSAGGRQLQDQVQLGGLWVGEACVGC
jgi:tRNA threonylcarbamoyladenosine modification (KEOPS) complex Cgi121 subunit